MNNCNVNFMSQYAFINGIQTHINDYTYNDTDEIKCPDGHDLILVKNVTKKIPHFRHKNISDTDCEHPMTYWHSSWQGFFPNTEKIYTKKPGQIKERRADVVLSETKVLEIQHSKYEKSEFEDRKHDYGLHGVEVIWLLDGNSGVNVIKLEKSNRIILEFEKGNEWKYEHLTCYNYIFIDINSNIYKINPNKVKGHMIDVECPKTQEEFIKYLNTGVDIWSNEEPPQCNIFIKQQGAGNGKTYGIIKMLEDIDKSHYKYFIYITKQHSAKHIIKSTFEEINNDENNKFKHLKNIKITESNKKYVIEYFNEISGQDTTVIIATIDSFTYSIGNKDHNYFDKFTGLIYSIIDGHIEKTQNGKIKFSVNPLLNKKTMLVIDEFQDPPEYYGNAIVKIMHETYIDVYIVGDKLQSISNEKNAFTYFLENEFPYINIVKLEPTNICRRFIHPELVNFVNFMIPFKKYGLPEITPYNVVNNVEENVIQFIKGNYINVVDKAKERAQETIIDEVDKIMRWYDLEVNEKNRLPEDFLIVTPFTQNNPLVDALLLRLNIFWKDKFTYFSDKLANWKEKLIKTKNSMDVSEQELCNINRLINLSIDEDYNRYAIFHKTESGTSIDLSESEYSTRIVSCHTSKGDGRKVVFVIGFDEGSIKKFSHVSNSLVYDSLLHVAITRMKEKLYIYYISNEDDVSSKINAYITKTQETQLEYEPFVVIKDKIKYSDLFCQDKACDFKVLDKYIIKNAILEKLDNNVDEKKIVDMGNHIIRYSALYINITLELINIEMKSNNKDVKKQLKAILHSVSTCDITEANGMKGYYNVIKVKGQVPIIKMSSYGRDYINYFNSICENMNNIKSKLIDFLTKNANIILCPLECIILYYMMEVVGEKPIPNITIQDLYNIVDIYNSSFSEENIDEHKCCLCNRHFKPKKEVINTKKINNMQQYLLRHFDKIDIVKNIVNKVCIRYPNINWLIKSIPYYEGNDNFCVYNKYDFVGYNDKNVIICYVKPQFNQLNYNDVLVDSIYDAYFLCNIKKNDKEGKISDNYKRFKGKNVITCIFSLDLNEPYYINWISSEGVNLIEENEDLILNIFYQGMLEKYKSENGSVYALYNYWRKFCPENEKKPINFIRFLKTKLSECHVLYVRDFFTRIELEIEMSEKKMREDILQKYDVKDNFMKKLECELEKSVKNYLNIRFEDDDSDDD